MVAQTCNLREAEMGTSQGQGLPELLRKFSLSGKWGNWKEGKGGRKYDCERQREENLAIPIQCSVSGRHLSPEAALWVPATHDLTLKAEISNYYRMVSLGI